MALSKGYRRTFVVIGLLTIFCLGVAVIGLLAILSLGGGCGTAYSESQSAVRVVHFTVKTDARDRFFNQLRNFSDENDFAIRIAPVRPDNQHFLIQLWRDDIKGIGVNSGDPEKFGIAFFHNSQRISAIAFAIHRLAGSLTSSLTSVNGVAASTE